MELSTTSKAIEFSHYAECWDDVEMCSEGSYDHEDESMHESSWESSSGSQDVLSESQSNNSNACYQDGQKTKDKAIVLSSSTEMLRIRFPFQSLSVRLGDFLCLQEDDFLNDTIIDFYLNHIVEHVLPDDPTKRVSVLPSVFWHNLSLRQNHLPDDFDSLPALKQNDARFEDILEFLADFELIDVDYIVVPVNEWDHWSLAVVCHPFTPSASIVCFDSQFSQDPNNLLACAQLVDEFLQYAYMRSFSVSFDGPSVSMTPSNLVQQENHYDCGVYILEFARRFLLSPPDNLTNFDFSKEYSDFSVVNKRADIQRVILSLCSNRSLWEEILSMLEVRHLA